MEKELEQANLWMTLAEEKLVVACDLLRLSHFDEVISKSYYVMFYAAKAALLTIGVDLRKHSSVVSHFGQRFVKTGYAEKRYSHLLTMAMQAREDADYNPASRATREAAQQAIAHAESFLEKAREIVEKTSAVRRGGLTKERR